LDWQTEANYVALCDERVQDTSSVRRDIKLLGCRVSWGEIDMRTQTDRAPKATDTTVSRGLFNVQKISDFNDTFGYQILQRPLHYLRLDGRAIARKSVIATAHCISGTTRRIINIYQFAHGNSIDNHGVKLL